MCILLQVQKQYEYLIAIFKFCLLKPSFYHISLVFFLLFLCLSTAMSFFGLTEYQKISQYIFEETFNLRFAIPFEQHNSTLSMQTYETLTDAQKKKIRDINALDIELYDFAKELMFQRYAFRIFN